MRPQHHHRRGATLTSQKGFFAVTVMVLLAVLTLAVVSFSSMAVNRALLDTENRMTQDASKALDELESWYKRNFIEIAQTETALNEDQLLAILHHPYPGLRLAMSTPILSSSSCSVALNATTECVPSRVFAAWYPSTTPTGISDVREGIDYGAFTGNAIWSTRSTRLWDIEQFARSESHIDQVGMLLRSWMKSRQMADKRTMYGVNWWRHMSCASDAAVIFLPCVNNYTELRTTVIPAAIGIPNEDTLTPYGWMEFSNLEDARLTAPFSVSLRVRTPWGQYIQKQVAQPS